jgi:hypothetical protein
MALAGRIFLDHDLHPATQPTVVTVGGASLYGYDNYNGIGIADQTFARGARIRFEPQTPTGVSIDGRPRPPAAANRLESAVVAGDEILWDWPRGRLIIDSPKAKAYVGKFAGPFKFKDGIVLGDVTTPSVTFAMVSMDGRPLVGADASRRIGIGAVADARNTGFQFDWAVKGGPAEMAKAVIRKGELPVQVDPVHYTLWFPTTMEARFGRYDFALRPIDEQPISGKNRISQDGPTPFMSILTTDHRGGPAPVPDAMIAFTATGAESGHAPTTRPAAFDEAPTDPWDPIPHISWETNYASAHKSLHDSNLVFSSINPLDPTDKSEKTIVLSDARLPAFWNSPADVEIAFSGGRVGSITITLKQPPPFAAAMSDLDKRFGPAAQKQAGAQFEQSFARWDNAARSLGVVMTESQGTLKILFNRK